MRASSDNFLFEVVGRVGFVWSKGGVKQNGRLLYESAVLLEFIFLFFCFWERVPR